MGQYRLYVRRAGKGLAACQQFVKDNAQRIDVGPVIERLAFRLLRAEIVGASQGPAIQRQVLIGRQLLGDAEVGEPYRTVRMKKNVGRLYVPVNDASAMDEVQAAGYGL